MRIALISDLHGNELALRAVLADARQTGVDQVICLGDTAALGPKPREVLQILRELDCVCIMGNHDEFLFNPSLLEVYTEAPVIVASIDWCRDVLDEADLAFVRAFVAGTRIDLGDGAELLLFHGSPRSHMEDLLATTAPDELDRLLDGERATVLDWWRIATATWWW